MNETAVIALTGREAHAQCAALADILIACVNDGASVSFMAPLARDKAEFFWHSVADAVDRGERVLLVAQESRSARPSLETIRPDSVGRCAARLR